MTRSVSDIGFSIVIPVYNAERHLRQTLQSVESQSYATWEVILVDDGSEDTSPEICKEFVARQPRQARLITQANAGPAGARMVGVDAAAMEYVICLDGDDLLRRDALEVLAGELTGRDWDIIQFNLCDDSGFGHVVNPVPWGVRTMFEGDRLREVEQVLFEGSSLNNLASKVIARDLLRSGMVKTVEQKLRMCEDLVVVAGLVGSVSSFLYLPENLYFYRPNPGSASRTFNESQYDAIRQSEILYSELSVDHRFRPSTEQTARRRLDKVYSSVTQLKYLGGLQLGRRIEFAQRVASDPFFREAVGRRPEIATAFASKERVTLRLLASRWPGLAGVASVVPAIALRMSARRTTRPGRRERLSGS